MQLSTQFAVQRKHQRYLFSESLVVIRRLSPTDARRVPGICMEISESGMSAIVTDPLTVGDEVELIFDLSRGDKMHAKAVVRNQNHFRHGFEFIRLGEADREKVRAACASLSPYEGGWY